VRRSLAAVVNAEEDLMSCGEVACTETALEAVKEMRPQVVVIDVSLARGAGLELIQRIRKHDAAIRIVALAMSDKPEVVERVLSAGAAEFVVKTDLAARVLEAIRRSRRPRPASHQARNEQGQPARQAGMRSERCLDLVEREIVQMIGRGIATRAIAVRLGMSVAMVEAYRRRIRGKLNFPTATQLVQFCVRWAERAPELTPHD
jgi:DNA-binding NarL/FixJ family response regulator